MQLALDHAVVQLAALIRLAAVAALEQRVRAEQILLHRAVFRRSAEVGVQLFRLLQVQQTLTVRRIGKQYTRIAVIALGRVRTLEKHRVSYTGLARVLDGQLHTVRVDVAADDIEFSVRLGKVERTLARLLPDRPVKAAPLLRVKAAQQTGRTALRDHGRLNRNRARAAERVEERVASAPARQLDHSRRQRLTERRRVAVGAVAALVQTGTRGIEVQLGYVVHDGELNLILFADLVKPGLTVLCAQARYDCLFDDLLAVRNRVQRRVEAVTLDRKCAVRRNELLPRECFYALEQLVERFGFECADADEHTLGAPQVQVRPCKRVFVTGEQHAAVFRVNIGQPAAEAQFVRDDALQPEQGRAA